MWQKKQLLRTSQLLVLLIFISSNSFFQNLDSLPFKKVNIYSGKYIIDRFGFSELRIKTRSPQISPVDKISLGESKLAGTLTLFTGMQTSLESNSIFLIENYMKDMKSGKLYLFQVYVEGSYEKSKERINNPDGSVSTNTVEQYDLNWENANIGFLILNNDTLSTFNIVLRENSDSLSHFWRSFNQRKYGWISQKLARYADYELSQDFMILGVFKKEPYKLISSAKYFRTHLLKGELLSMEWQDSPQMGLTSKKNRVNPYLLYPKADEKLARDHLLLCAMARSFSITLSRYK
ncbi:hypothetical protein HZR84_00180 [Hyphobacterium sp. CCMP332]|nr:hypothetical protein HZR84_00180 [Hyphobacterium sp. CCMP332]